MRGLEQRELMLRELFRLPTNPSKSHILTSLFCVFMPKAMLISEHSLSQLIKSLWVFPSP